MDKLTRLTGQSSIEANLHPYGTLARPSTLSVLNAVIFNILVFAVLKKKTAVSQNLLMDMQRTSSMPLMVKTTSSILTMQRFLADILMTSS